jgi:hypothetical protein
MMISLVEQKSQEHVPPLPPATAPLWAGVVGVPAAWALQMEAVYALPHWACEHHGKTLLLILNLCFLALCILGGVICLRYWMRHESAEDKDDRTRFLASYGLFSSGMFSLLIIAQTIATWMLDPCAT